MIRVLVAEDSVTVRELLVQVLKGDPQIEVVGQAKNGLEAVELTERLRPDLVTMDVQMPVMDGFEATKEIMARVPTPILIVSASNNDREVEMSMNAMRAGAMMVMKKPGNPLAAEFDTRQGHLVAMVKALSQVKVVRRRRTAEAVSAANSLRSHHRAGRVRVVAIAASTGGPAALQQVLGGLPGNFPVPILVVQHIASGFVQGLSDWLDANCGLRVKVAESGELALARTVYLAPDECQMGLTAEGRILVAPGEVVGGVQPSATHLFESVAQAMGPGVVAVILTGMGSDGVAGLPLVKSLGGCVLAQDEGSCIVYGMPREALAAGVVDQVVSLQEMARRLEELAGRNSS